MERLFKPYNRDGPITREGVWRGLGIPGIDRRWRQTQPGYAEWGDTRNPPDLNVNESVEKVIKRWDPVTQKRFRWFVEKKVHQDNNTPWARKWALKTYPNYNKQQLDIIDAKFELVRRLMILNVQGPQSPEDWLLLFMAEHPDIFNLPNLETTGLEQLLHPNQAVATWPQYLVNNNDRLLTEWAERTHDAPPL